MKQESALPVPVLPTTEDALPASVDPPPLSREQKRSRRKRDVRARTVSMKRMTKRELNLGRALYPDDPDMPKRPMSRTECREAMRPCPYVSCEHHLFLDVSAKTGAIKLNFPDLEPWELAESCALDIAERGGATLERVGEIMNLTRERVRQVEVKALAKIQATQDMEILRDFYGEGTGSKRRLPVITEDESDDEIDPDAFASDELAEP